MSIFRIHDAFVPVRYVGRVTFILNANWKVFFFSHASYGTSKDMVTTSWLSHIPLCVGRIDVRRGSEPDRKWDWQVRGWGRSPSHCRYSGCSNWEVPLILFGQLPAAATTTCRNCCFRLCRNKRTVMITMTATHISICHYKQTHMLSARNFF